MSDRQHLVHTFTQGAISRRTFVSRALALGLSMSAVETVLAACGGSGNAGSSGPTTVNFTTWGGTGQYAHWRDLIAANDPAIKDIHLHVTVGGQGDTDVAAKLRLALSSGKNIPDVIQLNRTGLAEFASSGQIATLDDVYASIKNDIYPGALDLVSYQGKSYAIPYEVKSKIFFYRADLFDQANIKVENIHSIDDFINAGKELHGKFPKAYILNLGPQPAGYWLGELLSAYPDALMADTSGNYQVTKHPAFADSFQFLKQLYDSKIALPIDDWSNDWQQSFNTQTIAGSLIGNWMKFFLPGFAPQQKGLWKLAPWPQFSPLKDQRYGAEGGGSIYVFPVRAPHSQQAITLFSHMFLTVKSSTTIFQSGGTPPVFNSAKSQVESILSQRPAGIADKDWNATPQVFFGNSYIETEFQTYNYVKPFNYDPQAAKEFGILNLWLQKYVSGKVPLTQALAGAENDMKTQIGNPYSQ